MLQSKYTGRCRWSLHSSRDFDNRVTYRSPFDPQMGVMRPVLIRIVLCLGAIMALTFQVGAFSGRVSAPTETDPITFVGSEAGEAARLDVWFCVICQHP